MPKARASSALVARPVLEVFEECSMLRSHYYGYSAEIVQDELTWLLLSWLSHFECSFVCISLRDDSADVAVDGD